ncbi:glycosyltransferase family 4 protein [Bergeyella sp. RCAD1439]|uniref:glycosyltransferase family 4 protein n=1 Tax=Bergeyella anatis TaxID=3113737 RepID=UPI002E17F7F4|nr:glycosyltransferase family 4 protein [Bergeyella sp. RCAD1439]
MNDSLFPPSEQKHLVIIGLVIPEPHSTAAGKRMMQLMELFRENHYRITFLTAAHNEAFAENIAVEKIRLNDSRFDETIRSLKPDAVLFDRFLTEEQFGWRVRENVPHAMTLLDTEDLHFLREARRQAYLDGKPLEKQDLINTVFKREMASILRCDLSLIISDFEMKLLSEHFGIDKSILLYLPLLADPEKKMPDFAKRNHFVFIGNFLHQPNWHTVLKLKKIWPNLRKKCPDAQLHVYGAYTTDKALALHNEKEGFWIKGRCENLAETLLHAKVMLAPIPFGAGLKGKLLDSMQYGLPNVTSSIGAEGLLASCGWNGFVEDEEENFIAKAALLYQDEPLWKDAQSKGITILNEKFSKEKWASSFANSLQVLHRSLAEHRQKNFLSQILQHHTLNATKYLSKWIEEKEKR